MKLKKKWILPLALLLLVIPYESLAQRQGQATLRRTVVNYYSFLLQGRYELMWNMLSKSWRSGTSRREYLRLMREDGGTRGNFQIQSIRINGRRATVKLKHNMRSMLDQNAEYKEQEDTWILENGFWRNDTVGMGAP